MVEKILEEERAVKKQQAIEAIRKEAATRKYKRNLRRRLRKMRRKKFKIEISPFYVERFAKEKGD